MAQTPKLKVLNIIESFGTGATETWLLNVVELAKQIDPHIEWHFYTNLPNAGRNDDKVQRAGGTIRRSPCTISGMHRFMWALRSYVKREQFDIVHCQHDFLSALYLMSIAGLRCRKRIVHVHNTDDWLPMSPWKQRLLLTPFWRICLTMANHVVGVSNYALDHFLRFRPRVPARDKVLYCGIDLNTIHQASFSPTQFRQEFGFHASAKVILFLGRMVPLKNPVYAFEVMRHLLACDPNAVGLFAGDGGLTEEVRSRIATHGLGDRIKLLGWRDDGARLMKNCDLFLFPRLETPREALGLAVVESQACGLPMLTSPGITDDAKVIPSMVEVQSLDKGPAAWANCAQSILRKSPPDRDWCFQQVLQSPLNISNSAQQLIHFYRQ